MTPRCEPLAKWFTTSTCATGNTGGRRLPAWRCSSTGSPSPTRLTMAGCAGPGKFSTSSTAPTPPSGARCHSRIIDDSYVIQLPVLTPTLRALTLYFLRLGATGFGGPVALANAMRRDLVDVRGWVTAEEFEDGLALAAACPGPLAYQLAVYLGY